MTVWNYSGTADCRYDVSGIVPVRHVVAHLPEGVTFMVCVDALPLTDAQRHDLEWGFVPNGFEEIVAFAAQEFCHRAPWSVA